MSSVQPTNNPTESSPRKEGNPWRPFKSYVDEQTGIQVTFGKSGSTFSPAINFKHLKEEYYTRHGRVSPDFNHPIDEFRPLRDIIEALQRIEVQADIDCQLAAQIDKDNFFKRKARRESKKAEEIRQAAKPPRKKGKT